MELLRTPLINDSSLVGYYRFENGSPATDSSSAGRHLISATPAIANITSKYNYYANVTKGWRDSDDYSLTSPSAPFSMVGWLRRTGADLGGSGSGVYIEHTRIRTQCIYSASRIAIHIGGSDRISYSYNSGLNKWIHIAFVSDGTTSNLYLNGVEVAYGGAGGSTGTNRGVSFGVEFDDQDQFNGQFDDIAIFTRKLTVAEINWLAQDTDASILLGVL